MGNLRIGLLVSGGLGNDMLLHCANNYNVSAILTDKESKSIIQYAIDHAIPHFIGNPRGMRTKDFVAQLEVDIILSINYLFIIEQDLIKWPKLAAINFHGSLLPKYRGRTPHVWAIINNENETGVSAHFITDGCDEGDLIEQVIIPIDRELTGADVLHKYAMVYPTLIDKVVLQAYNNSFNSIKQDNAKATYFEKRTPEDGLINWNWQKERIKNWVRAQAHPYPGAFALLNGNRVIIDRVEFDDCGFFQKWPNGKILSINPIRVKTPNGVLLISEIRSGSEHIALDKIFDLYEN